MNIFFWTNLIWLVGIPIFLVYQIYMRWLVYKDQDIIRRGPRPNLVKYLLTEIGLANYCVIAILSAIWPVILVFTLSVGLYLREVRSSLLVMGSISSIRSGAWIGMRRWLQRQL